MILKEPRINVTPLNLPLKTTFKQASSSRKQGESVWASASRGKYSGYGEGCPRTYVTDEDVNSCLKWLSPLIPSIEKEITDLAALQHYTLTNSSEIDKHPAAWCAVETALLDLFAKEQQKSVERLLVLNDPQSTYQYTAILGDSNEEKYQHLIARYLKWGFADFKIKLSGDFAKDDQKGNILIKMCEEAGRAAPNIRLDANNLWSGRPNEAITYLSKLNYEFIGIEEPIEPKNAKALSEISSSLNKPVILDESLCNESDLKTYEGLSGRFIANIKVSRVGGVLRGTRLIGELKKRNWKIIIGAHVGETSIMTRAGMTLSQLAGESLIGHEGGFGTILLESEPVQPSLMFGAGGRLDLSKPYATSINGQQVDVPTSNWDAGWGLRIK